MDGPVACVLAGGHGVWTSAMVSQTSDRVQMEPFSTCVGGSPGTGRANSARKGPRERCVRYMNHVRFTIRCVNALVRVWGKGVSGPGCSSTCMRVVDNNAGTDRTQLEAAGDRDGGEQRRKRERDTWEGQARPRRGTQAGQVDGQRRRGTSRESAPEQGADDGHASDAGAIQTSSP